MHDVLKGEKEVRPEHMSGFVKITAFINESLRLKTPVFAPIVRQAKIDHKIKDIEIKKGTGSNYRRMVCFRMHYGNKLAGELLREAG